MPRPRKCRYIKGCPCVPSFKPTGRKVCDCAKINLEADELETVKLIDVEGLDQEGAAQKMQVSRITVQRIYKTARRKIADALVNGKVINFEKVGEENATTRWNGSAGNGTTNRSRLRAMR